MSTQFPKGAEPARDKPTSAAEHGERNVRVWPASVSAVARWCRAAKVKAIPQGEVAGANERERVQLAALGGVAAALARRSNNAVDFRPFPKDVRDWLECAKTPPDELVEALYAELKSDVDPLALVYERIVSGPRRRRLGTFFTPRPVLDYMKPLVKGLPERPRVIADPGAGVGAFTVASRKWWPDAEVHAVDVNLVTLGLLATRPDTVGSNRSKSARGRLCVRHEDFLEWLMTTWPRLAGPRLVLGNPPYTRHQAMSAAEKIAAQAAAGALSPGARSGLSTYFLAASLASLEASDSLCLLLPANWLEADYARSVRQHIWKSVKRRVDLHLFPNELNVFPGAQVAAMVLVVGPERSRRRRLRLVRVAGDLEHGFVGTTTAEIDRVGTTPVSFTPEKLFAARQTGAPTATRSTVPLGEVAVVRRGVATGSNAFFLRTRAEADALPVGSCVPAISRLRTLEGDLLDKDAHDKLGINGARCWLLNLDERKAKKVKVQRLIEAGEAAEVHLRYLCKTRTPWYAVERIPAPDILIGPMGKESFRVVINEIGAIPTNTLYGLRLRHGNKSSAPAAIRAFARWLAQPEGQEALRIGARKHHGDGLVKLEPGALAQVRVPVHIATAIVGDTFRRTAGWPSN